MVIVGKRCFICGKLKMPTNPDEVPPLPPIDVVYTNDIGYIGMITLDSISTFPYANIKIKFSLIEKTRDIIKMAIESTLSDTLIGMIGISDNIQTTSCIVAMKGGGNTWTNKVYALPEWTETLTDIVFTDKSLVTSSRFDGEPWTFGVRYINTEDLFYYDLINEYCYRTKFDTENLTATPPYHGVSEKFTWHTNDATIRMVAIPYSNDVTIAYESRYFINQSPTNWSEFLSLFYIDGSLPYNITMSDARLTSEIQDIINQRETFLDMKYIKSNQSIAILQNVMVSNFTPKAIILLFSWNTNAYLIHYSNDYYRWTSMDVIGNNLWIGGWETNNNGITQHYLNQQYPLWMCGLSGDEHSSAVDIAVPNTQETDVYLLHSTNLMKWVYDSRIPAAISPYSQPCIDYGDKD